MSKRRGRIATTTLHLESLEDRFVPASVTFQAESAQIRTSGGQIGNNWILNSSGYVGEYLQFATNSNYTVSLSASGTAAGGQSPMMSLVVDGATVQTWNVTPGTFNTYTFSLNISAGTHELKAGFINDYQDAISDRNLYVDWLKIATTGTVAAPTRTTSAAWAAVVQSQEAQTLAQLDAQIQQNRTGNATLRVVDLNGVAIPGATVSINQSSHDFRFGSNLFNYATFGSEQLNQMYLDRFSAVFNDATIPFYWDLLEPVSGQPNFTISDMLVNWAVANDVTLKGHPLLYNAAGGYPSWIAAAGPTLTQIQQHVVSVMQRYAGAIDRWDVINEPVHFSGLDAKTIYAWARAADPSTKLEFNEYGEYQDGNPRFFSFLQTANSNGTTWDAIGLEGHTPETDRFSMAQVAQTLNKYATLNKPIYITEFSPTSSGAAMTGGVWTGVWDANAQADYAVKFYKTAFANPAVAGISWWDLSDTGAHVPGGGLLDANLNPKPAYTALSNLINNTWHTSVSGVTASDGSVGLRGFFGDYDVSVSFGALSVTSGFHLTRGANNTWQIQLNALVGKPTVAMTGPATLVRGQPGTFTLVGAGGMGTSYNFAIDWNGDGTTDQQVTGPSGTQVSYVMPAAGLVNVRVSATDLLGKASPVATTSFNVKSWALQPNSANPALMDLVYGGTTGDDYYTFIDQGIYVAVSRTKENGQAISVTDTITGVTGNILLYAQAGNDTAVGSMLINKKLTAYGGDGNDVLVGGPLGDNLNGGNGNDVLIGLAGDDALDGGAGSDVLIGSAGADQLNGQAGSDLVLAAATNYDRDPNFWFFIQSNWSATNVSYSVKTTNLLGRGTQYMPYVLMPGGSIANDTAVDQVLGGADQDWLLYDLSRDLATDVAGGELATRIN